MLRVVCRSSLCLYCSVCSVRCSSPNVRWLSDVCDALLFYVCCLLRCVLLVVCRMLLARVVCWEVVVVCCLLSVMYCLLTIGA